MKHEACKTSCNKQNVGNAERVISAAIGAFFLYKAFSGKHKWLSGALGAALIGRGATGYCGAYDLMDVDTSKDGDGIFDK